MSCRQAAAATRISHFASRNRPASFAGRGAPDFSAAAPILPGDSTRYLRSTHGVLARDYTLQAAAQIHDATGHDRLDEGRGRRELQPGIGGEEDRPLVE